MPFVQLIKENFGQKGVAALNLKSDFDEAAVIRENVDYLLNTLEVRFLVSNAHTVS